MPARPGAPCLREDISIIQQVYRGETSFVVKDLAAGRYFRFGAAEVRVLRAFDGHRTHDEIAAALAEDGMRLSAQAVESFARTMANAGFLERALEERTTLQIERLRAERHVRRRPALFRGELLRMRWSFGDPDAMLTRTLPYVDWIFVRTFVLASLGVFVLYGALLGARSDEFGAALASAYSLQTITVTSVVVFWLMAALVILIHELGHAYACKHFGGEVRELGFMLLYFQPAFYCNVSDAWSFPERRARLWVTAAGGWIQLFVAGLAALVWWAATPGTLVADAAVAAMLVGGATTLLTNANPLLPLDGYFALTDWMEIPNLRLRAFAHFRWWLQRHLLRLDVPEPSATARERRVFLIYGGAGDGVHRAGARSSRPSRHRVVARPLRNHRRGRDRWRAPVRAAHTHRRLGPQRAARAARTPRRAATVGGAGAHRRRRRRPGAGTSRPSAVRSAPSPRPSAWASGSASPWCWTPPGPSRSPAPASSSSVPSPRGW